MSRNDPLIQLDTQAALGRFCVTTQDGQRYYVACGANPQGMVRMSVGQSMLPGYLELSIPRIRVHDRLEFYSMTGEQLHTSPARIASITSIGIGRVDPLAPQRVYGVLTTIGEFELLTHFPTQRKGSLLQTNGKPLWSAGGRACTFGACSRLYGDVRVGQQLYGVMNRVGDEPESVVLPDHMIVTGIIPR